MEKSMASAHFLTLPGLSVSILLAVIPALFTLRRVLNRPHRPSKLPKSSERVLVLGASSGIGRTIAHLYSERGARVCVLGRREQKIAEVLEECKGLCAEGKAGTLSDDSTKVLGIPADFANMDDMIRVRTALETNWQGVDTVIVAAGVSALQPLMAVAGVETNGSTFTPAHANKEGIQRALVATASATRGNYVGPLVAAVTFIPLLSSSSKCPSILLVSSLAAVIPPPTRTLYASTKAASLVLYQALSIEHPSISFSFVLPSTVEGDFRASAVDGGKVLEDNPNEHGLKREDVAKRCIMAVDGNEKTVFIPGFMRFAPFLYWAWPSFVEWRARKKYNFSM